MSRRIPLAEPVLRGREWEYVKECLDTGWVSSVGSYVTRFEEMVAAAIGAKHAIAAVNGTAALHIALQLAGVKADTEVIAPTLTFIASANVVRYAGADPVFVDCDAETWQMDLDLVEEFLNQQTELRDDARYNKRSGRRVAAILPVHVLGCPVEMDRLLDLGQRFNIPVVEDATESLGTLYRDRGMGAFGLSGGISFNGNKILTTGGGGMIVTDDDETARHARHLTTQAKANPAEYIHDEVGYNYRLTNVLAAIGCAQMEQLDTVLATKRRIAENYHQAFPNLVWQKAPASAQVNHWLPTARINPGECGISARDLVRKLSAAGITARPLWQPMHLSPAHGSSASLGGGVASALFQECISLPCSANLAESDQDFVIATIKASLS